MVFLNLLDQYIGKMQKFSKKKVILGWGGGHLVLPYEFTNSAFTRFTVTGKKFQKHILLWLGFCTQNSYIIGAFADNIFQLITQYLAKILGGESGFFRVRTWVADTYIPKRPRTKKIFGFGCTLAHSLIVGEYLEKKFNWWIMTWPTFIVLEVFFFGAKKGKIRNLL